MLWRLGVGTADERARRELWEFGKGSMVIKIKKTTRLHNLTSSCSDGTLKALQVRMMNGLGALSALHASRKQRASSGIEYS